MREVSLVNTVLAVIKLSCLNIVDGFYTPINLNPLSLKQSLKTLYVANVCGINDTIEVCLYLLKYNIIRDVHSSMNIAFKCFKKVLSIYNDLYSWINYTDSITFCKLSIYNLQLAVQFMFLKLLENSGIILSYLSVCEGY